MSAWKQIGICWLAVASAAVAGDWPHWRGPNGNGVSTESGWLDHWPDHGPPTLWKAQVGTGFASFAVAGGRVYTTGNENNKDTVFAFAADSGKALWKHSYEADLGDKFFEGGTTSTPTVEGDRVYTFNRWGDVYCFAAADGAVIWQKNVHQEAGLRVPGWGFGGSPTVFENELLLNAGEAGLALDKATGKLLWQSANKDSGYSTPLLFARDGKTLAIFSSGRGYGAVEPLTGKALWSIRWMTEFGVNASDPIVDRDRFFLSTGYGKGAGLFKLGAGDPEEVWKSKIMHNQFNSSVLLGGYLYGVDGDSTEPATLKCVELATGAEKWGQPGFGSGALIAADGKLITLNDHGELAVAPATPEGFKPTARAQILGGKCWTTPVLANGRIYCRNAQGDVACLDVRPAGPH